LGALQPFAHIVTAHQSRNSAERLDVRPGSRFRPNQQEE
jgi:hypothetical protein